MSDVYRRVLALRTQLWQLADEGRLDAPDGADLAEILRQVDDHLHTAEGLLRTPTGTIRERCAPSTNTAECACAPNGPECAHSDADGCALDAQCASDDAHSSAHHVALSGVAAVAEATPAVGAHRLSDRSLALAVAAEAHRVTRSRLPVERVAELLDYQDRTGATPSRCARNLHMGYDTVKGLLEAAGRIRER